MVLAVAAIVIITVILVLVRVKRKRAALLQHDYDDIILCQMPQERDQQQIYTIDGRQESNVDALRSNTSPFVNEGESTKSNSTIPDTKAVIDIRTNENSAYQPSTNSNFLLAMNPAYGTINISTAPEIETEENIAYHCDITSSDC